MTLGSHKDVAVLGWLDSQGWQVYLSVFQQFSNFNADRPFLWFALFHGTWTVFSKSLWHLLQLDERSYSSWMRDVVEGWKWNHSRENVSQRTQWGSCKSQCYSYRVNAITRGKNPPGYSFWKPVLSVQQRAWIQVITFRHKREGAWNRVSWTDPFMSM